MRPSWMTLQGWKLTRRQMLCAAALVPVFALVALVAYWLRFDADVFRVASGRLVTTVLWAVPLKVLVFGWFHVYQGWARYVTFHDLITLIKAATVSALLVLLADYLTGPAISAPRSVLLMDWGLTIVAVGGLRSLGRVVQESDRLGIASPGRKPVFIVGANDSGEALLRAIRRNSKLPYRVAGFIGEDLQTLQTHIGGVPVIGVLEDTCYLAQRFHVPEVLITAGELSGQQVRRLVEEGQRANVSVKVLPSYEQLLGGAVDLRPRQVSIEDLLRRDPVQLNMRELHRWIDGQVLLVTGSAGSIGSEICRQLLQFAPERLVLVDRSESGQFFLERELRRLAPALDLEVLMADIHDQRRMEAVFRQHRPGIVFHAAAYKHVPMMETNVGEAVKNIAVATRRLADVADAAGVGSFVMISTDKAVNPTSVMGVCKRVAELYVQALAPAAACRFVTVRFGNVLDSAGSVVPIFREQIARGGPITVTHPEMCRFFMTIPEASQLVIQAGAMGAGGEIFVLDMGEPVRIVDLARDLIRLSGLAVGKDIEIEFTGVRPGEKLYEELHCAGERHLPTNHAKIMIAESERTDLAVMEGALEYLEQIADGPADTVRQALRGVVPQYAVEAAPPAARSLPCRPPAATDRNPARGGAVADVVPVRAPA